MTGCKVFIGQQGRGERGSTHVSHVHFLLFCLSTGDVQPWVAGLHADSACTFYLSFAYFKYSHCILWRWFCMLCKATLKDLWVPIAATTQDKTKAYSGTEVKTTKCKFSALTRLLLDCTILCCYFIMHVMCVLCSLWPFCVLL